MKDSPFERIVGSLRDRGCNPKAKSGSAMSRCPAHEGASDDLSVRRFSDGAASVKCFAGCNTEQILAAIGLTKRDLFPDNSAYRHGSRPTRKAQYSKTIEIKNADGSRQKIETEYRLTCTFDYHDEEGKVLYQRLRWDPADNRARKTFTVQHKLANGDTVDRLQEGWHEFRREWKKWVFIEGATDRESPPSASAEWIVPPRRVLFNLPQLMAGIRDRVDAVYLCEGEPDALSLRRLGLTTTTSDSGAANWPDAFSQLLTQFQRVVIVADRDPAGIKSAYLKTTSLRAYGAAVECVFPAAGKDAEDHILAGYGVADFEHFDPEEELAWMTPECAEDGFKIAAWRNAPPMPPTTIEDGTLSDTLPPGPLPTNDLEASEYFVNFVGKTLRYCAPWGVYLEWDGTRYLRDDKGASNMARYQPFAKLVRREAARIFDELGGNDVDPKHMETEERVEYLMAKSRLATATKLQNQAGLKAVEYMARQIHPMPVDAADLDENADLLPLANTTIHLPTGQPIPSSPDHLFTKRSDVRFDPAAECPRWLDLLDFVFDDPDMADYLRMVAGYSLTGHHTEHSCFFFYGVPRSGKSTIMNTLFEIGGEFSMDLPKQFVMVNRGSENIAEHFARLKGARMVSVIEVMGKDRFDEGLLKKMTGSEKMTARAPFEKSVTFEFTGKLWISGNERPQIAEQGEGIWTRFKPIVFHKAVPESQQDHQLPAKLKDELPGILNWALTGAVDWYRDGRLPIPRAVADQLQEYRLDVDVIRRFIAECCNPEPGAEIRGADLFEAYSKWCKSSKIWPMQSKQFFIELKSKKDLDYRRTAQGFLLRSFHLLEPEHWNMGADVPDAFAPPMPPYQEEK